MQVNKINNDIPDLNFQAKIIMKPEILKYIVEKQFDRNQGRYAGLIDFQYSPLEQRKILYNILKHMKKDKTHKTIEIGGGYWMAGDHTVHMKVDGVMGERWSHFHEYSQDSIRPDYIERIWHYAQQLYPKADFAKKSIFDKISSIFKGSDRKSATGVYERLALKIKNIIEK